MGKIKKAVVLACFYLYNRIVALFMPENKNLMIFCSETGDQLTGNLKCMYDYFKDKDYCVKMHVKSDRREIRGIKETIALWKDLTTAGFIFLDDFYMLTSVMKVRNNQELIQLWHGAGAFKKFGFSRIGTGDNIRNINGGYRKYTKVITSSEEIRTLYAQAFDIPVERVAATGSPRTDVFFDEEWKEEIKNKFYNRYPQFKDKKIVLFAPTYRGRKVEDADYNFDCADLDRLQSELGEEYIVLTKWHPALYRNIKKGIKESKHCNDVYDLSDWEDINELLVVADILVTDYSSVIFDYYFMNKPVVFFAYDLDEYGVGRGLYYDFEEYVYGNVASNRNELAKCIKNENLCADKRKEFGNRFLEACDGYSTIKTAAYITERTDI